MSTWKPENGLFGKILEVKSLKPTREKTEFGKVTKIFPTYAIIEDTVFVSSSIFMKPSKLWDEYEYEAIESEQMKDGHNFEWRGTRIIKKIECKDDRQLGSDEKIQMRDVTVTKQQHLLRESTDLVAVYNTSAVPVTLKSCEITSNHGFIRLDRKEMNVTLSENNGRFSIYLKISPKQVGTFVEEVTAEFGDFQKKCLVTLEVNNDDRMMQYQNQRRSNNNSRELIPGQKVRASPRFIEIRIMDYQVPADFRQYDFKMRTDLLIHELNYELPFLFEDLTSENYVAKMRYCLYLEEIAMEIQFAKYKIERGHFENKSEYLRLQVEGIAEKRPSITIGDSIRATDKSPENGKRPIYEGCIHKVEQNSILVKFHPEFHQRHNSKDYRIDFIFSRTSFKRQQNALDKAVSQVGLGFDFIFPRLKNFIKNCQIDVKLGTHGKMEIGSEQYEFFNKNLNKYQKEAITNVLRGESRPLPYIIYGPPGTNNLFSLAFSYSYNNSQSILLIPQAQERHQQSLNA